MFVANGTVMVLMFLLVFVFSNWIESKERPNKKMFITQLRLKNRLIRNNVFNIQIWKYLKMDKSDIYVPTKRCACDPTD